MLVSNCDDQLRALTLTCQDKASTVDDQLILNLNLHVLLKLTQSNFL